MEPRKMGKWTPRMGFHILMIFQCLGVPSQILGSSSGEVSWYCSSWPHQPVDRQAAEPTRISQALPAETHGLWRLSLETTIWRPNKHVYRINVWVIFVHLQKNAYIHKKHYTSSTAQGGGGSFKNRKPIGELGCCESGMAERIHWWTERCLRSPLFLSLSLTTDLTTYLPTYLSIYLSVCLPVYLWCSVIQSNVV